MSENIERKCRVCGCTDSNACPGGCYWVQDDLCSKCQDPLDEVFEESQKSQNSGGQTAEMNNSPALDKKSILNKPGNFLNQQEKRVRALIFEIRTKGKLKDKEIAEKLGWSRSYLSYLKNSKTFKKYFPKKGKYQEKIFEKLEGLRESLHRKSKGVDENEPKINQN